MYELYSNYESTMDLPHRRRFGQFFTDERVAQFMVRWSLAQGENMLYDPAFGLGAFYLAARAINKNVTFTGSEIDPAIINCWFKHAPFEDLTVSHEDYLLKWGAAQAAIVCNPPYMRFQKFISRDEVLRAFAEHLGVKLSGYTNIASAFLLKSISELKEGGRLAYIMPLEFLNTGYGTFVKRQLTTAGKLHAIIRLDCEKDAFPDVTTTAGIILFEKAAIGDFTRFYVVRELGDLEELLDRIPENIVEQNQLQPSEKWAKYFESEQIQINRDSLVPLSFYGAFSRGIATGANDFFVLKPSQIVGLGLANSEIVKCITKSIQIRKPVFTNLDLDQLLSEDMPVYLLNIYGHASERASKYILQGEARGFNKRYLTRVRNPWYRLESRQPSPLLFGVFSRDGYKIIRNCTNALNLTCYHGFQPNLMGAQFVDRLFLYLMSMAGRKILSLNMRKYGQSLDKFEPNDLNQALVPSIEWFSRIEMQQAIKAVEGVNSTGTISDEYEETFSTLIQPSYFFASESHIA